MSIFELWMITALPNFVDTVQIIISLSIVVMLGALALMWMGADWDEEKKNWVSKRASRWTKIYIIPMVTAIAILSLVPSERQIAYIIGGYVATNADGVETLPDNFARAANKFLEKYAEEE